MSLQYVGVLGIEPIRQTVAVDLAVLVSGNGDKVLWPVIEFLAVDVMNVFLRIKVAPQFSFEHEAVLWNVAVPVGVGVPIGHDEHVATSDSATALPAWIAGALGNPVALDVREKVSLSVSTARLVFRRAWCRLAAAAQAQAAWIDRFDWYSSGTVNRARGSRFRPMRLNVGLALRRWLSAATAARLSLFHVLKHSTLNVDGATWPKDTDEKGKSKSVAGLRSASSGR